MRFAQIRAFGKVKGKGVRVAAVNRQPLELDPPVALKTWRRPWSV